MCIYPCRLSKPFHSGHVYLCCLIRPISTLEKLRIDQQKYLSLALLSKDSCIFAKFISFRVTKYLISRFLKGYI